MPKYNPTFTSSIYTYTEIKRHGNIALFEGVTASGGKQYELHILRYRMAHPKSAEAGTKILSSPSTSDWGQYGFTFMSIAKAMKTWITLVEQAERKHLCCQRVTP